MEEEESVVVEDLSGGPQGAAADLSGASQDQLYKAMLPYRAATLLNFNKSIQEDSKRFSRTVILRDTGEGPGPKVVHLDGRGNVSSFYYIMRPEWRDLLG